MIAMHGAAVLAHIGVVGGLTGGCLDLGPGMVAELMAEEVENTRRQRADIDGVTRYRHYIFAVGMARDESVGAAVPGNPHFAAGRRVKRPGHERLIAAKAANAKEMHFHLGRDDLVAGRHGAGAQAVEVCDLIQVDAVLERRLHIQRVDKRLFVVGHRGTGSNGVMTSIGIRRRGRGDAIYWLGGGIRGPAAASGDAASRGRMSQSATALLRSCYRTTQS